MSRLYVYADESGDFDFSPKGSKYFILTTIIARDLAVANQLQELRRELAWDGIDLRREFHAADDKQVVRNCVFDVIGGYDFRVDATILDKRKTRPHVRSTDESFYQTAWYYHMKYLVPQMSKNEEQLLVIAASVGTKAKRQAFHDGIRDVMQQVSSGRHFKTAFWPAATDPCLQIADYCSWAIQRKWENNDDRSYLLIKDKISSEYNLFASGQTNYY
jgi:hypothetical protein